MDRLLLLFGTDPLCADRLALAGLCRVRLLSVVFSATAEVIDPGSPVARPIRPLPAHVERTLHALLRACAVDAAEVTNPMGGFDTSLEPPSETSHPLHL